MLRNRRETLRNHTTGKATVVATEDMDVVAEVVTRETTNRRDKDSTREATSKNMLQLKMDIESKNNTMKAKRNNIRILDTVAEVPEEAEAPVVATTVAEVATVATKVSKWFTDPRTSPVR
jgi:hypothetical protein